MTNFTFSDRVRVECDTYENSRHWGHRAELYINERYIFKTTITYYNRTWEAYQYQSILYNVVEKALKEKKITKEEAEAFKGLIKNDFEKAEMERVNKMFGSIAMIAKMGELLTDNKQEANTWKARMIKAGLGEGIQMPEDWESLSEEEKEARLNKVIDELGGKHE